MNLTKVVKNQKQKEGMNYLAKRDKGPLHFLHCDMQLLPWHKIAFSLISWIIIIVLFVALPLVYADLNYCITVKYYCEYSDSPLRRIKEIDQKCSKKLPITKKKLIVQK